jgi:hypothetical protein
VADENVDEVFAEIIAHWDDSGDVESPRHDAAARTQAEDVGRSVVADAAAAGRSAQPDAEETPAEVPWPVWRGALVPIDEALERAELAPADAEDAHFEPGPLAPLPPTEDLHFWGIVVGLVAGPLLLLWLVIVRPDVSGWWTVAAVALTVGGFALLVLRQPATRDADDPDNGARI